MTDRLTDLSAAVTAAENMPTSNRRAAHDRDLGPARRHRRRPDGPSRRGLTNRHREHRAVHRRSASAGDGGRTPHRAHWRWPRTAPRAATRRPAGPWCCWPCSPRRSAGWPRPSRAPPMCGCCWLSLQRVNSSATEMLSVAGHSHGAAASPAPAMLVAHAVAVGAGAMLIAAGDRLCCAVSRAVEVAVRAVVAPIPGRPVVATAGADQPLRSALLLPRPCHIGVRRSAAHADHPIPFDTKKATTECVSHQGRPSAPSLTVAGTGVVLSIGLASRRRVREAHVHVDAEDPRRAPHRYSPSKSLASLKTAL